MKTVFSGGKVAGFSGAALLALSPVSQASMYVYPMEVSVGLNGAAQIRVISQSDSVQFIKVNLKKIIEPGTRNEREVQTDPADTEQFIITPQKIALAAGSERVTRLVSITPPAKETTWRAYFEGVSGDTLQFSESDKKNDRTANVGVNIVYGALIHVAPATITPSLKYRNNTGMIINDGTVRIPVKALGVCDPGGLCQWTTNTMTIYPETELSFPGMNFTSGKNYRIKYFNWIDNKTEEIPLPALQVN